MELNFEKFHGLVPVVIQDHVDGQVLMVGFMNQEAWKRTLAEGEVVYYSRSRDGMWKKGETSGNVQKVKEVRVDCDNDTVLLLVEQIGQAACHKGYVSRLHQMLHIEGDVDLVLEPALATEKVYGK